MAHHNRVLQERVQVTPRKGGGQQALEGIGAGEHEPDERKLQDQEDPENANPKARCKTIGK